MVRKTKRIMILLIYITGFITSYIIAKYIRNKSSRESNWLDIFLTILCSLASWFAVIIELLIIFIAWLVVTKPLKWL